MEIFKITSKTSITAQISFKRKVEKVSQLKIQRLLLFF